MSKDIYNLGLHDQVPLLDDEIMTTDVMITRVPGGWIYERITSDDKLSMCFVPFNREFDTLPHGDGTYKKVKK